MAVSTGDSSLINISDLMGTFDAASAKLNMSMDQLGDILGSASTATSAQKAGIDQQTAGLREANFVEGAAATKLKADNAAAAAHWGTNVDASSFMLSGLADSIRSDETKLEGQHESILAGRQAINDKLNQSFFDDPGQWMINQFTLPSEVYAQNFQENTFALGSQELQRKSNVAKELMARTSEEAATNAIIDTADQTRMTAAKDQILLGVAQQKASESTMKLATMGLEGVRLRDANTKAAFDSVLQLNSAIVTQQQYKLAAQNSVFEHGIQTANVDLARARFDNDKDYQTFQKNMSDKDYALAVSKFANQKDQEEFSRTLATWNYDFENKKFDNLQDEQAFNRSMALQGFDLRGQEFDFQKAQTAFQNAQSKEHLILAQKGYDLQVAKDAREATNQAFQQVIETRRTDIMQAYKELQMKEKEGNDAAKATLQDWLNKASTTLGTPSMSIDVFKQMTGPVKQALEEMMMNPFGGLGYNAADAVNNANRTNAPLTPGQQQTKAALNSINQTTIQTGMTKDNYNALKPEQQLWYKQAGIEKTVNEEMSNIKPTGGLYSPPPLLAVVSGNSVIASLPLAKQLATLATKDPNYPTKATDIVQNALTMITNQQLTPEDAAAQVTQIYSGITKMNNKIHQYDRFNLPMMDSKSAKGGFNAAIGFNTGVGGLSIGPLSRDSQVIDMTNKAQVTNVLLRATISRLIQQNAIGAGTP